MKLSIIGGDLRTVKLIKLLAQDENTIKVWGFENNEEILKLKETLGIFEFLLIYKLFFYLFTIKMNFLRVVNIRSFIRFLY